MTTHEEEIAAAALARSDLYLREFVEKLNLCPWARFCREGGRLQRKVLLAPGGPPGSAGFEAAVREADAAVAAIEALPEAAVEVGLLIFPALDPALAHGPEGAKGWGHFCSAVRAAMAARQEREPPFFCVPFHPDFAEDLSSSQAAVRFIRRSPDPTLQLVRASLLREVRGAVADTLVVPEPGKLTAEELAALEVPESVSDKIARQDLEAIRKLGPEKARELLERIRRR